MKRVLIFGASVIRLAGLAAMANTFTLATPTGAVDRAGDSVSAQPVVTVHSAFSRKLMGRNI